MIVNGIEKARFCLQQAEAASVLANALADPLAKRLAARGVFVAVDAFVSTARQSRNQVPDNKANKFAKRALKDALNVLADRDWGPYAPLRDRIGAHRQPITDADDVTSWEAANELFAQIDAPLVGVLRDDMQAIFDQLAPLLGADPFTLTVYPVELLSRIERIRQPRAEGQLFIATGSFGQTQADALTPLQGGTVGERLRQISDTADGWDLYGALSHVVAAERGLMRAVLAGAVIETANVIELIFDVPGGRGVSNRFAPLVELIPVNYAEKADLLGEWAQVNLADVQWIRDLRNRIAAHIDTRTPLPTLLHQLETIHPDRLTDLFKFCSDALVRVDNRHQMTVMRPMLRLRNATMQGVTRVDPPELRRDYNG